MPAGAIIDERYEVVRFLGKGSFGEVYEVVDRFQNVTVALKLLTSYPPHNPWQEAQHLTALRSEYILPVLNADHFGGALYVVTKLATNGSAADRMKPCGIPPATAIRWIRSACRGA
jgi:serine/threonine-protein kinase